MHFEMKHRRWVHSTHCGPSSKKLAEGVSELVLDVKTGSGAFMETLSDAQRLARSLVDVATGAGLQCSATISEMGRPLGEMVGHALEVQESIECLKGEGPDDLRELVVTLAGHPDAADILASGRAYARFQQMVAAQGGDLRAMDASRLSGIDGVRVHDIVAERTGSRCTGSCPCFGDIPCAPWWWPNCCNGCD